MDCDMTPVVAMLTGLAFRAAAAFRMRTPPAAEPVLKALGGLEELWTELSRLSGPRQGEKHTHKKRESPKLEQNQANTWTKAPVSF
jgi:hypothetical protein